MVEPNLPSPGRLHGPRPTALHAALLFSLLVHGALLAVRLADPQRFERMLASIPLEVILVNARSEDTAEQAQAIAQARLAGGGDADQGRATSPLPAAATVSLGDAPDDSTRRIEHMQQEQQQLLARLRRDLAALPPPDPLRDGGNPAAMEQEDRRRQMLKMLAEIEKRIEEENARPKKRYVSPATREAPYALYYDKMRRRIEERGTRNFPETGGRKLYGELTMNVTVDAAGRVVDTQVVESSGTRRLDQQAMAIVRAAAPFGPFTRAMQRESDQIVVTSRFRFNRDDSLETTQLRNP